MCYVNKNKNRVLQTEIVVAGIEIVIMNMNISEHFDKIPMKRDLNGDSDLERENKKVKTAVLEITQANVI